MNIIQSYVVFVISSKRSELGQGYPLNLSILLNKKEKKLTRILLVTASEQGSAQIENQRSNPLNCSLLK